MDKRRLESFTDGVIAILITIMVLELRVPAGASLASLSPVLPVFLTYLLSFVYPGIYWNNHHHMFQLMDRVTGGILWANLHLLFWLSLVPFATGWMGENHFGAVPTALYGAVLFLAGGAYYILELTIIASQGERSKLKEAVGGEMKGIASMLLYALAVAMAFFNQWISDGIFILVALLWLVPDRRVERAMDRKTTTTN